MLGLGIRVIRGADWMWGDQDGGPGGVGTVCEIGQPGSKRSPDKTVVVNWDCGIRSNYRTGYQGQHDLLVVDNAQCGVRHPNIECDSCKQNGIMGMRYKCTICLDYDLCTLCYHADKHDLEHIFFRFDTAVSNGVKLTQRTTETKTVLRGIFVGATVQRGHDWKWGNQDGGEGSTGIATEICNWANESGRSVAGVKWKDGSKNDYRVGHKGIVDLKYVMPASGGCYFVNHLPILGKNPEIVVPNAVPIAKELIGGNSAIPIGGNKFNTGDRVKVVLDIDTLKHLQQGHGGWNPRMAEYIGKIGLVHRITERGDVRVQYEGCPNRWTFHPGSLVLVSSGLSAQSGTIGVGDIVRVINDSARIKLLQRKHGDWVPAMEMALGKIGRVMNIYSDGDLRIQIQEEEQKRMWTFNPLCVTLVQKLSAQSQPGSLTSTSNTNEERPKAHPVVPDRPELKLLMSKVAQGNLDHVKMVHAKENELLDTSYCGKTPLQVASYQGHTRIVEYLLSTGCVRAGCVDDDGDTALHDAAFGNQPEILELLLAHEGVDINAVNRSRCTALHIASHKCLPHCVRVLIQHNPNVNLQDTYGDTPLHDAINNQCPPSVAAPQNADNPEDTDSPQYTNLSNGPMKIIQMLCDVPEMDFSLANKRGFNVLQHAALKGNAFACEVICTKADHLVNIVKDDGFSALHLAALNGHRDAVLALINIGKANLDLKNNRSQTPLLLAVSQGHCNVIELLIGLACEVTALDEDGNTALHIAILKKANTQSLEAVKPNNQLCPGIHKIYEKLTTPEIGINRLTVAIVLFLISKGCDPDAKNKELKTFYDLLLPDQATIDVIMRNAATLNDIETEESSPEERTEEGSEPEALQPRCEDDNGANEENEPNSSRLGAFGEMSANVNHSPFKRNHYNYINYGDNTDCNSTSNSPLHQLNFNKCAVSKPNNSTGLQPPARPSRTRKAPPPPPVSASSRPVPAECVVCCELSEENVTLEPCGHRLACEDCAPRMKKCLTCGSVVERRVTVDGRVLASRSRQPSAERLRYLETKIQEIEEAHGCGICLERRRAVAFLCGHGACAKCARTLHTCHMCRQPITTKINLY